jgi:ABC-2 type transport system ATP-binding protein
MAEADEMCDRVAIIDRGRIVACAPPHELKKLVQDDVIFTLRVKSPSDGAFDFVRALPGVRTFAAARSIDGATADLKLVLESEAAIADLMSALSARKVELISLSKAAPTLEDVFVKLVGRGLGADDMVPPQAEAKE